MDTTADPRCRIAYLIPHLPQSLEEASIFGWYTEGLHAAAEPILVVATLPADIREPHADINSILIRRLTGTIWPLVTPIETPALPQTLQFLPTPFRVCISTSREVAEVVDTLVLNSAWPILHASTVSGHGRTPLAAMDVARIGKYVRQVLDAMSTDANLASFVRAVRQVLSQTPQRIARKHPLKIGLHNVVRPNELALEAFGRKLVNISRISVPITVSPDHQRYVSRICASADAVYGERERLLKDITPDIRDYRYVLAVPSIFWGFYRNWKQRLQAAPEALRPHLKHALKNMVHASTYFDNVPVVELNGAQVLTPVYAALAQERAKDMLSFTATLASIASHTLAPVLRLEPKVNGIRKKVNDLAHCVRAAAPPHFEWKASRMAHDLGIEMRNLIDPKFLDRIDKAESNDQIEGLKLVADAPLEFLKSDGVPLALRFDCSRISPVPGNLSHQIANQPPLRLPTQAFDEVLIIRSFLASDPLREMLYSAIQVMAKETAVKRIRFRFVDVSSATEVVDALNSYSGSLVVFDCHGIYNDNLGMGSLMIGASPVNFWELRGQCALPPIVMFSACDTQPIDGSHSSVATSAFILGAHAVLGTFFPISAYRAALFNARMLLRLEAYIPAALKTRKHVTWREVVSGMLRMSYVTEVMDQLGKHAGLRLSREVKSSIQYDTTSYISARHPDWHRVLIDRIASEAGRSPEQVQELIDQWCSLTDAMKHVQLGNPERIIITELPPKVTVQTESPLPQSSG